MPLDFLISTLVTLVVVMDPLGLVPAYLALTHRFSAAEARNVAARASVIAGAVLIAFAVAGNWVLVQLGIGLPAFRIAGGLLLFAIAFEMVYGARTPRETSTAEQAVHADRIREVAAYPLAIPLIAGPGAITATLLLAGRATGEPAKLGILIGVIVVATALCAAAFLLATPIKRMLGTTGNTVLSRLLGIVLAALAVQFVIDGVRAVLPP